MLLEHNKAFKLQLAIHIMNSMNMFLPVDQQWLMLQTALVYQATTPADAALSWIGLIHEKKLSAMSLQTTIAALNFWDLVSLVVPLAWELCVKVTGTCDGWEGSMGFAGLTFSLTFHRSLMRLMSNTSRSFSFLNLSMCLQGISQAEAVICSGVKSVF